MAHVSDVETRDGSALGLSLQPWTASHLTGIGFGIVAAIAAAVRLHAFDRASLWLDEGSTVYFSRLPGPMFLGFTAGMTHIRPCTTRW